MGNRYIKDLLLVLCGVFLLVTMYSCANMASPNGGPYDETPPKFISSLPAPNQTNYKGRFCLMNWFSWTSRRRM